jgi:hypothetical protein
VPPAPPVDRHLRAARRVTRGRLALVLSGSLAALASAALASACALDWSVRAEPAEASVAEGGADAPASDAPAADAPLDTSAEDAPASPDAAACDVLAADVANARKKARECQIGTAGQCTTTVVDECGCKVVIRTAGSTEAAAYASAISALVAGCGKPAACATTACPQLGIPTSWACLVVASETRCTP